MDALRTHRPRSEAQLVDLPVGRCLSVVDETMFQTPTNIAGGQAATMHRVRQLQLIHPLAGRGELAFFTMSTECLRDWEDYVAMMAEICKTIEWSDAGGHTTIGSVLEG